MARLLLLCRCDWSSDDYCSEVGCADVGLSRCIDKGAEEKWPNFRGGQVMFSALG